MKILPYRLLTRLGQVPKVVWLKITRRKKVFLFVVTLSAMMAAFPNCWWLAKVVANVLMLPASPEPEVMHFYRNRHLSDYLEEISDPIVEPINTACESLSSIKLLILVTSVPENDGQRHIIRRSWSPSQVTFFVMGMQSRKSSAELYLAVNKLEAQEYNDLIVFDFVDHYQNLTLKTALMLRWVSIKCPQALNVMKTDDDVIVNPWTIQTLINDHPDSKMIGFSINNTKFHRDPYDKYYVPRWLIRDNRIEQFLSGTGYLVKGAYVEKILKAALRVPLINIEDVYFTSLVAKRSLNFTLTHDSRLNPTKPWFPFVCSYWNRAIIHHVNPKAYFRIWHGLKRISRDQIKNKELCNGYSLFNNDFSVYWHLLY